MNCDHISIDNNVITSFKAQKSTDIIKINPCHSDSTWLWNYKNTFCAQQK